MRSLAEYKGVIFNRGRLVNKNAEQLTITLSWTAFLGWSASIWFRYPQRQTEPRAQWKLWKTRTHVGERELELYLRRMLKRGCWKRSGVITQLLLGEEVKDIGPERG